MSDSLRPHESQHARSPCLSQTPGVHPNSCPSSRWCHPATSSSVIPFSSYPQSLPASESFPMSQLFTWGGQSTGASVLTSFLPKNIQGWLIYNVMLTSAVQQSDSDIYWARQKVHLSFPISYWKIQMNFNFFGLPYVCGCICIYTSVQFSSVQSLSHVWLFATPWTAAHQASLSITNSWSLLKLMSIELVMPSNHLVPCCPLLLLPSIFPSNKVFSNQSILGIWWPKYWSFSSASVLPMNIQDWLPLGLTGFISLLSKGLSRVFFNTIVQKHQFFSAQPSLWSNSQIHTWLLEKPQLWLYGLLLAK